MRKALHVSSFAHRYDVKPDGHVVQIDAAPIYDQPPTIDELFLAAAKNHELERAYYAQRSTRARRRDAQHDVRAQVAQAFLTDPEQRALVLTEKSVLVATVDVAADDGYASGRSCRYSYPSS